MLYSHSVDALLANLRTQLVPASTVVSARAVLLASEVGDVRARYISIMTMVPVTISVRTMRCWYLSTTIWSRAVHPLRCWAVFHLHRQRECRCVHAMSSRKRVESKARRSVPCPLGVSWILLLTLHDLRSRLPCLCYQCGPDGKR